MSDNAEQRYMILSTDSGIPLPWKLTKIAAILTCRHLNSEERKQGAWLRYYPEKWNEPKYNNFPELCRTEESLRYLA